MDNLGLRDAMPQPQQSDTRNDQFWRDLDSNISAAMAAQSANKNLEVGPTDLGVGLLGSTIRGAGTALSGVSLGNTVRAARSIADGSVARGLVDKAEGLLGVPSQNNATPDESPVKLADGINPHPVADLANKAADVAEGVGDWADNHVVNPIVGTAGQLITDLGSGVIKHGTSDDYQDALYNRKIYDGDSIKTLHPGSGIQDPAVWAAKLVDGLGSITASLGVGALSGGMAKKIAINSMLKRGVSKEIAEETGGLVAKQWGARAATATSAGMSIGGAGQNTKQAVLGMSYDELSGSQTFRDAFNRIDLDQQTAHLSDSEKLAAAREETANVASRATMSDAKTWGAAALGSVIGDANLFKMLAGKGAGSVLKGFTHGALGEGLGETVENGMQQYAQNQALNEVANANIDPMKGVASSAIEGGIIGMGTGGAVGAVGGIRGGHGAENEGDAGAHAEPDAQPSGDSAPISDEQVSEPGLAQQNQTPPESQATDDQSVNREWPTPAQGDFPGTIERDKNGVLRVKGEAEALSSWADKVNIPYITDRDGIAIPAKYAKQAAGEIKRYKTATESAVDPATPAQGDFPGTVERESDTNPNVKGVFSGERNPLGSDKFDPVSKVPAFLRQSIGRAGSETDSVFGPLKTMRITKRGNPFSTEKEAATASRKGKEMPVPLNGGGFGVADIAEVEQAQAAATTQPSAPQLDDNHTTDSNQPSDQPANDVSAETVSAPSAPAGEASPLAPAIDTGYRAVIPATKPAEETNEPATPVPESGSEGPSDQLGTGEPDATGAEPAPAGIAGRARPRDQTDRTDAAPVPDGQQQDDQTLTAPATDAGADVSESAHHEPVAPEAAATPTPWAEIIDNPNGTITLKGEVPLIKQWAKESGVKAYPGKGGMVVAPSSADKVREYVASTASEPVQQSEGEVEPANKVRMSQQQEGGHKGLSADEVAEIVSDFRRKYKGAQSLDFIVGQTQEDLYGPEGSPEQIGWNDGGYLPSSQQVHLIADSIARRAGRQDIHEGARGERGVSGDPVLANSVRPTLHSGSDAGSARAKAEVVSTLRHEVLGHYGLDTFTPSDKKALLQKLIDAKNEKWIAPVWKQIAGDSFYGKKSELHQAEEVFAHIAEKELPPRTIQAWNDIKTEFSRLLRKVGLVKGHIKEHELDSLIRAVAKGISSGERARQNIRGDKAVIGKQADKPVNVGKPEHIIRFSKQATYQGEKPAKHLTRKEAELVAKAWFKQYQGASDIDLHIHATQADMERALGMDAKEGLIRRAAFDDDTGALHVAADTIANPKRMREILRHEVLAHYGLANVLGSSEYTKLMSRLIKSKSDPSMKAVWEWVSTHYADEDIGTQAEEVVAHLAELEQSAWRRGWDRVVALVTRALRAVGFAPEGITAAETRSLIEGLGKKLQRGSQDSSGQSDIRFSQEAGAGQDAFKPNPAEAEAYRQQLAKAMASPRSGEIPIDLGSTPMVLQATGAPDLAIRISRDIVRKAVNGVKHDVSMDTIEALPELLSDPVAIFDSKTHPGDAMVVLLDAQDGSGRPVVTALQLKVNGGKYLEINRIASVHGRPEEQLQGWVAGGLAKYIKKNHRSSLRTGLQLPLGSSIDGSSSSIISEGDVVNFAKRGGIKFSQSHSATDEALQKLNLGPKPDIIDKTKANLDKLRKVDRGVVSSWVDRFIKKANTEVLDALAPIKYAEDAAGITEAEDSGYVAARMATGAASTMQATMLYGLPEWKDGVIQRKAGTGEKDALLGIFSDLGSDLHNWLGWMAGHRAELLMEQGRENLLSEQDIAALKGLGEGKDTKFMEAKARWNRLNAATLDLAQEAGLFTREAREEFENEWYIPFFRESDDGDVIAPFKPKGIANQNAGIKKLKGGEANTADLLENIFSSTSKLIDASMKNMAAQKTVWNLADTGIIDVIAKPNMMDWRALKNGKDLITVKLEGEDYMIRVNDPALYRAMTFFDKEPPGQIAAIASKAKRILTAGVTASPEFMLRNFLRDSLSSWAISRDGFKPIIASLKGVKKTLAMEGSTIDVMFSGASFLGGYVDAGDPESMSRAVRKTLRRKGMTPEQIAAHENTIIRSAEQVKDIVSKAWETYHHYGSALENANREAVYDAAIKAGKSHAKAAFDSRDLMDFSMMGSSKIIQGASMILPFFNARIQGLGKLSREVRDNPREIAKRAGMITAMSLGLLAMNWDDERYEGLKDWDKDSYWHFWVGDQHWRMPKPFEIGVMFGTIPERIARAMNDKDTGAKFGKAMARAFGDTFALNPIPQIAKPIIEAAANYDFFKGEGIDGPQDLAVQAQARYDDHTSLLMRELGELSGFSPKQLEHLLIGYTGTVGAYVMAAADGLIRASQPGESASWRADEIPLIKAIYQGDAPAKSTQHMEEFYQMLSEVNQLKRTVDQYRKEGMTDQANELLDEQGGILKSRKSLSRTQKQVRVIRNKINLIQRDRTLSAAEKRQRIDRLFATRNDLVYQAVNHNRENWD